MESLPLQGGRAHPVGSPSMKSLAHLHYFMCEAGSWDRERRVAARMSVVGTGRHRATRASRPLILVRAGASIWMVLSRYVVSWFRRLPEPRASARAASPDSTVLPASRHRAS